MVKVNDGKRRILITGAGGFVGRALTAALDASGRSWLAAARKPANRTDVRQAVVGDIGATTDWRTALPGIDCVIHLAARTHVLHDKSTDPLAAYRAINLHGTAKLAEQAALYGVRRFIFLSSIKVNGEATDGMAFTEQDPPMPQDAYGITKLEAENALSMIAAKTGLEVVILRPPLIYGPGVKGNFLRLFRWIDRGLPLPLASVNNRRSLIYVNNLVDLIAACIDAQTVSGKTYLVCDGEDLSTPELINRIAASMGQHPSLLHCPVALLNLGAYLLGKSAEVNRLTGSLQVDGSAIRKDLRWHPRYTINQGLTATAEWYHRFKIGNA